MNQNQENKKKTDKHLEERLDISRCKKQKQKKIEEEQQTLLLLGKIAKLQTWQFVFKIELCLCCVCVLNKTAKPSAL